MTTQNNGQLHEWRRDAKRSQDRGSTMTTSFNRVDLNLLRVFDAVMDERSVLRASHRVCLSQSAVSHALARLREMLGDELFVPTTSGMQPTARALTMAPLIREAWKSLEAAIGRPEFAPATSDKRFTIAVGDFVTTVMIPDLLRLLRREAPLVDLVMLPDTRVDLAEQIDLGQIDAAIGTFSQVPARFRSSSLFVYDDVLIANSSRKLGKISLEALSRLSIAAVSLHGEDEGIVGGFISQRGVSRRSEMYDRTALEHALSAYKQGARIALSMPHFLALPALLGHTDLIAIVPRPLAQSLVGAHKLSIHELPYEPPPVDVSVLWHERTAKEASHQWLREMLRRATEPLRGSSADLKSPAQSAPAIARPAPAATSIARRTCPAFSRPSNVGDLRR
jgi:DNA-binding transcriptional LysR family regulator